MHVYREILLLLSIRCSLLSYVRAVVGGTAVGQDAALLRNIQICVVAWACLFFHLDCRRISDRTLLKSIASSIRFVSEEPTLSSRLVITSKSFPSTDLSEVGVSLD